ncbi:hypothetical protein MKZ38_004235 [Zalerion maritima]|uniref:Uncharacterized protein n=1 Tax=Zalerion maritima TaxID=339359 RepID=A0AAD5RMK7_9PEZI|nr:hypothetical protein MKZ38_004235 [Zalerion maritima]
MSLPSRLDVVLAEQEVYLRQSEGMPAACRRRRQRSLAVECIWRRRRNERMDGPTEEETSFIRIPGSKLGEGRSYNCKNKKWRTKRNGRGEAVTEIETEDREETVQNHGRAGLEKKEGAFAAGQLGCRKERIGCQMIDQSRRAGTGEKSIIQS